MEIETLCSSLCPLTTALIWRPSPKRPVGTRDSLARSIFSQRAERTDSGARRPPGPGRPHGACAHGEPRGLVSPSAGRRLPQTAPPRARRSPERLALHEVDCGWVRGPWSPVALQLCVSSRRANAGAGAQGALRATRASLCPGLCRPLTPHPRFCPRGFSDLQSTAHGRRRAGDAGGRRRAGGSPGTEPVAALPLPRWPPPSLCPAPPHCTCSPPVSHSAASDAHAGRRGVSVLVFESPRFYLMMPQSLDFYDSLLLQLFCFLLVIAIPLIWCLVYELNFIAGRKHSICRVPGPP